MKSLELAPNQLTIYNQLMDRVETIEKRLRIDVDQTNSENVLHELNFRQQMLSETGLIIEAATMIYDFMQGLAAEQLLLNEKAMAAPAAMRTNLIKGYLAKWSGLYERAIRSTKTLDKSIDGLRSMLSYNKQLIASNVASSQNADWQNNS